MKVYNNIMCYRLISCCSLKKDLATWTWVEYRQCNVSSIKCCTYKIACMWYLKHYFIFIFLLHTVWDHMSLPLYNDNNVLLFITMDTISRTMNSLISPSEPRPLFSLHQSVTSKLWRRKITRKYRIENKTRRLCSTTRMCSHNGS